MCFAIRRQCAGFGSCFEQRAGLCFGDGQVFFCRQVACLHGRKLAHFALGNRRRRSREPVQDTETVGFDQQVECAGEQEVTDEDRGIVAPDRLGRRLAAPHRAFVDDIVVKQRGGVDELDCGRERMRGGIRLADRVGRDQRDQGAKPLAASGDDVSRQVRNDRDWACGPGGKKLLDLRQIARNQPLHTVHHRRQCRLAFWFRRNGQTELRMLVMNIK